MVRPCGRRSYFLIALSVAFGVATALFVGLNEQNSPRLGAVPATPAVSASPVARGSQICGSAPVALRRSETGCDPPLAALQRLPIGLGPATPFRTSLARQRGLAEPCHGAGEHGGII